MKYNQLTPKQKEWAYEKWVNSNPLDYEWWHHTIENYKDSGKARGFRIDDVHFSGFSSQGDGAYWIGHFDLPEYLVWEEEQNKGSIFTDQELVLLNTALAEDCVVSRNKIIQNGWYSHSGTMYIADAEIQGWKMLNQERVIEGPLAGMDAALFVETLDSVLPEAENKMLKLCREYADDIYKGLEEEYEYLLSEDAFKEATEANDWEFNDEGELNG